MRESKRIKVAAQREKSLKLNLLTFEYDKNPFTIGLYKNEKNLESKDILRLNKRHWPSEVKEEEGLEYLYTDFADHENADFRITVKPEHSNPLFLKAYYQYQILKYIRAEFSGIIINRDFISNPEIWLEVHSEDQPSQHVKRFDVFGLKMKVGEYTIGKPELMISHRGVKDVYKKSIYHFQEDLNKISRVVNKVPEVKKYKYVIAFGGHNLRDYYPVVNKYLQEKYQLSDSYRKVDNKYIEASSKISYFYKRIFDRPDFYESTGLMPRGFFCPFKKNVRRVDVENHQMVFGGGNTYTDPFKGLKKFGPAKSVTIENPRILIIAPKGKEFIALNRLITPFMKGDKYYRGVSAVTHIPFKLINSPITYSDFNNPLKEVMQQINDRGLQSNNNVMAFFFSTIPANSPPNKKRRFYRVKQELLKRGFQVQGVDMMKLEIARPYDISWWHGPLCTSVLAQGGIPWKSGEENENELIIGIGAFNPRWSPGRFVGSSFSFDSSGIFRGFNFFDHENTRLLAGSIKKAVEQYIQEKEQLDRVVIHYYKDISREQETPIWRAINDLKPGVPVYLVSINKTRYHDEVLLDKRFAGHMPVSGTYFHMQKNNYLLFNNEKLVDRVEPKKYPFPVKLRIREIWSDKKRDKINKLPKDKRAEEMRIPDEVVHDLMSQVVRFSRMYWRSVKPQPLPVTIAYPTMLAEQVPYFENAKIPHSTKHLPFFL